MRTPAVPPVSVGSASGARLPSTFGCQCRRPRASSRPSDPWPSTSTRRSSSGYGSAGSTRERGMHAHGEVEERPRRRNARLRSASGPAAALPNTGPKRPERRIVPSDTARWHADVPAITARRRSRRVGSPAAPSIPSAPAWASMRETPTAVPARSPNSSAAVAASPPTFSPGKRTDAPIFAKRSAVEILRGRRSRSTTGPNGVRGRGRSTCRRCCTTSGRPRRSHATSGSREDRTTAPPGARCPAAPA